MIIFKKIQALLHLKHYPLRFSVHHFQAHLSVFTDSKNICNFCNEFEDLLENIVTTYLDIYILGDFNLHLDVSDTNTFEVFYFETTCTFFNAR